MSTHRRTRMSRLGREGRLPVIVKVNEVTEVAPVPEVPEPRHSWQPLNETGDFTHTVTNVTPALAREWLTHNTLNRNMNPKLVKQWRDDMLAGRWMFAADPIRFSTDGRLLDGQKRLAALAGCAPRFHLPMLIVKGLAPETQLVMDQGSKRTAGDQLTLAGFTNASFLAAVFRRVILYDEHLLFSEMAAKMSVARIVEFAKDHPLEVALTDRYVNASRDTDAPPAITGCALVLFGRISPEDADKFIRMLSRGGGAENSPITALSRRLARQRRENYKVLERDTLGLFIHAWNIWRSGRLIEKIQTPKGGFTFENFPVPH